VVKYSLEIKQSAQKELDALDDDLFTRIDRKILALADNLRPSGCRKLKGYKDQQSPALGMQKAERVQGPMARPRR
jgi:mRNA-degrading endonuclease RelE of RelBE toxin-antitoxin system